MFLFDRPAIAASWATSLMAPVPGPCMSEPTLCVGFCLRRLAPQAKSPAFRSAGHGSLGRNRTAPVPHPSTARAPLRRRSSSQDTQYCVVLASCIGTLAAKASGLLQRGFCPGACGPLGNPRGFKGVARDDLMFHGGASSPTRPARACRVSSPVLPI